MKSFLFYDLETTGLNKAFDQVLQFAAIRTDLDLNVQKRYEIRIRLNPDTIPSPQAMLTHRLSIKQMLAGEDEFSAMETVHALLNEPGTCSLGFNTLGFDDEFLRFSFYRNLLPPYTHQYANNCSRLDLYPLLSFYYLYANDVIRWPQVRDQVSLKLEYLNETNHFATGQAHDAMVDVEATLGLAKALRKHKKVWDYLLGYFNKITENERLLQLFNDDCLMLSQTRYPVGLYIEPRLGVKRQFQSQVLGLGAHEHYRNQSLWLQLDTINFEDLDEESFVEQAPFIRKKLTEPGFVLPNKPRFIRLDESRIESVKTNLAWLKTHERALKKVSENLRTYLYPAIPNLDPNAALYQAGFPSSEDEALCRRFHQLTGAARAALIDDFQSERLKLLAIRAIARLAPKTLSLEANEIVETYMSSLMRVDEGDPTENFEIGNDYRGQPRMNTQACLVETQTLLQDETLCEVDRVLLNELVDYLITKKQALSF